MLHKKILDELHNLLVLLNPPELKYRIKTILKYTSNKSKVLVIKGYITLKAPGIYQYFNIEI